MLRIEIVVPVHKAEGLLGLCAQVREEFSVISAQCNVTVELGGDYSIPVMRALLGCTSLVSL